MPGGQVLGDLGIEIAELSVPVDMLTALGDLGGGLQAKPLRPQHPRHRPVRDPMPVGSQRISQILRRLGRPHQRRRVSTANADVS